MVTLPIQDFKLEWWLRQEGYEHVDRDVRLLRDVQTLRSRAAGHRKGSDHEAPLDRILGDRRGPAAVNVLLKRETLLLEGMREWRLGGG
jgi:hypothetical protein